MRVATTCLLLLIACATPAEAATWRDITPDIGIADSVDVDPVRGDVVAGSGQVAVRPPGDGPFRGCAQLPSGTAVASPSARLADVVRTAAVQLPTSGALAVALPSGALALADAGCGAWRIRRPRLDGEPVDVTALERSGDRLLASTRRGLVASDDRGGTWQRAGGDLPYATRMLLVAARGGDGVLALLGDPGRLACSADAGATFTLTDLRPDGAAVEPDGTVWAGAGADVLLSEDGCRTWRSVPGPGGVASVLGAGAGRVWVGDGRRVHVGDGATWRDVGAAASPGAVLDVGGRALIAGYDGLARSSGADAVRDERGLRLVSDLTDVGASADAAVLTIAGVLRWRTSADGGRTWGVRTLPAPDPVDSITGVVMPGGRILVEPYDAPGRSASDDAGATWQPVARRAPTSLSSLRRDPQRTGRAWQLVGRCASSSDDDGRTWQRRVCATRGATLLAPVADRGGRIAWLQQRFVAAGVRLARSRDGGRTWRRLPALPPFIEPVGVDGGLVAVARGGSIVRLAQGARAWRPWSQGLPAARRTFPRLAVRPSGRTTYALVDGRLFQRDARAARWSSVAGAPPDARTLIATASGLVVAGSGGIAILEDA